MGWLSDYAKAEQIPYPDEPRICSTCIYCKKRPSFKVPIANDLITGANPSAWWECTHPAVMKFDCVSGDHITVLCSDARDEHHGACQPYGVYWDNVES